MRILSITAQKPHSTGSGVYLTGLVRAFKALGHENAVVAGLTRADHVSFPDGTAFFPVYYETDALPFPVCGMSDEMPYPSTRYRDLDPAKESAFRRAFLSAVREAVSSFRPDLIVCHHLYLLTAFIREAFPDLPIAGVCHGSELRQYASHPGWHAFLLEQIPRLDRVCCLHGPQAERVRSLFSVPEDRVAVVGTGYDDTVFRPGPREAHEGCRIVFAGKISEQKGVLSLFDAFSGLSGEGFSLSLAGGFAGREQEAAMRARAAGIPGIRFLGRLDQPTLAETYRKGDVFVLPSFYEGLPLVLAEAMACGLQPVCTDLPGIREWMDASVPGHGIVFVRPPDLTPAFLPVPASLPAFAERLRDALREAAALPPRRRDLSPLSWTAVARRVLGESEA